MDTAQTLTDYGQPTESFRSSSLPFRTFLYSTLGLGTIVYYIRIGAPVVTQYYLNGVAIPVVHAAIIALLAMLTVMAIGCSIHVKVLGGFERTDIEREVKKEIGRLRNILATANTIVAEVEAEIFDDKELLAPRASESLRTVKKIITALEKRIQLASSLASTRKLPELCRATEILGRKLKTSENASTSLIDIDPFPAIVVGQIDQVIKNLAKDFKGSRRLAA